VKPAPTEEGEKMIDLVKKVMFTGIGVLSLSKDKVEEVVREYIDKGKLSEQEGEKLVAELLKKSEESRAELKKQIEEQVQAVLKKMDCVSKSDLAELKAELLEIKAKVELLEQSDRPSV
jgi:polyhydroxyalkanoate synthesis regulator phasin